MKRALPLVFLLVLCCALAHSYDFIVVGDTHFDTMEVRTGTEGLKQYQKDELKRNLQRWDGPIPRLLQQVAAESAGKKFVVQLGDLIQGDCGNGQLQAESYRRATARLLDGMHCPVLFVKGNHDVRGPGAEEAYARQMLPFLERQYNQKAQAGGANFALELEGDLFIFFDCMKPSLAFVRDTLAAHPNSRNTFFLSHFPVFPCTGNPADGLWGALEKRKERQELWRLLAARNAVVLCAHTHNPSLFEYQFPQGRVSQLVNFSMAADGMNAGEAIPPRDGAVYFSEQFLKPETLKQASVQAVKADCGDALRQFRFITPRAGFTVIHVDGGRVEAELRYGPGPVRRVILKEGAPAAPAPPLTQPGVCLTFDDRNFADWEAMLPVFERYGAHVTFFVCGAISEEDAKRLKRLQEHGHAIGAHGLLHVRYTDYLKQGKSPREYAEADSLGQLESFRKYGITVTAYACPMSSRNPALDEELKPYFRHIRSGSFLRPGQRIVDLDGPFAPIGEVGKRFFFPGKGIDKNGDTTPDMVDEALERAATRGELVVFYSHRIAPAPCKGNFTEPTEIERILQRGKELGLRFYSFDELP